MSQMAQIRENRLYMTQSATQSKGKSRALAPPKVQEYVIQCAMKLKTRSTLTQVKEAGLGQRTIMFPAEMEMEVVLGRLRMEFGIDDKKRRSYLINKENQPVNCHTVKEYIRGEKRDYKGHNKLYLLSKPIWMVEEPPPLQEVIGFLQTHDEQRTNTNEGEALTDDPSVSPYGKCAKVLMFAKEQKLVFREVRSAAYGEFLLIPNVELPRLSQFDCPEACYLVEKPLIYWLNNVSRLHNIQMLEHVGQEPVWHLPGYVGNEYDNWIALSVRP